MSEELDSAQLAALRDALLKLRAELAQMLTSSKSAADPVDLDQPIGRVSRMDAMQQQSMLAANREAARQRQRQVAAALERFEEEEYGDCLGCGEPVDRRRLAAHPETPFCIGCQTAREKRR
jgi:DnaK suppressor protein